MKKKIIIISIILGLIIIGFILFNNRTATKIYIDINPSIQINLNKNKKVKKVIPINEDAKKIKFKKSRDLEGTIDNIVKTLVENDIVHDDVQLILYSSGLLRNDDVEKTIRDSFERYNLQVDIIRIEKVTKEDIALAKKYNITPSKAAYINSIIKDNNIPVENLVNKSTKELIESKNSGYYCDEGYELEGAFCLKEIKREKTTTGMVCPDNYMDYNDMCYEEGPSEELDELYCFSQSTLIGNYCVWIESREATAQCDDGEYDNGSCVIKNYIGDAYEFCRDPGRTLYEHKCLATKPTINGGCLGSDIVVNGNCVNIIDDYYEAEWKCDNGEVLSNHDGSLKNDDKKCYDIKKTEPTNYTCEKGFTLNGTKCEKENKEMPQRKRVCSEDYTNIDNRCLNLNKAVSKENGKVCEHENSRLIDNICIIYERVEAKHN